jgi:uncharacterized protein
MMEDVRVKDVIFKCITGSQLYGTATPESDVDVRGVFISPEKYYFGYMNNIEQVESKMPDVTLWEIRKFFRLCIDNNPNILELLFIPPEFTLKKTDLWEEVIANRDLFLSTKARHTFAGYAVAQLHRIKQHHEWLLHPVERQPQRSDFGLPDDRKLITEDQLNAYISLQNNYSKATVNALHIDANFLQILKSEQAFQTANKHWGEYVNWQKQRNPMRHDLEAKFGYDTKHASHLARLTSEGLELLTTGKITFPRPDVEELVKIRKGGYTYDDLMEKYGEIDKMFDSYQLEFVLPHDPDRVVADKVCQDIVKRALHFQGVI